MGRPSKSAKHAAKTRAAPARAIADDDDDDAVRYEKNRATLHGRVSTALEYLRQQDKLPQQDTMPGSISGLAQLPRDWVGSGATPSRCIVTLADLDWTSTKTFAGSSVAEAESSMDFWYSDPEKPAEMPTLTCFYDSDSRRQGCFQTCEPCANMTCEPCANIDLLAVVRSGRGREYAKWQPSSCDGRTLCVLVMRPRHSVRGRWQLICNTRKALDFSVEPN